MDRCGQHWSGQQGSWVGAGIEEKSGLFSFVNICYIFVSTSEEGNFLILILLGYISFFTPLPSRGRKFLKNNEVSKLHDSVQFWLLIWKDILSPHTSLLPLSCCHSNVM